jgi:hypothetical protein
MSSRNQRPVGRRSATSVFYLLAIGSGVMRTVSVSFDIVALNTMISDSIAFGFMAQWLALGVTVVLIAFLSIPRKHNGRKRPIGYSLDPDFGRLQVGFSLGARRSSTTYSQAIQTLQRFFPTAS